MIEKLNFALVCDNAFSAAPDQSGKGKVSIIGIFQYVQSNDLFPMMMPQFSAVLNFKLEDNKEHKIVVFLETEDREKIATINALPMIQDVPESDVTYIGVFSGVILSKKTNVWVCYKIDNDEEKRASIIRLK